MKSARGRIETFIIEDGYEGKKFSNEIPSSHLYAKAALGHSKGDTIEISDNPLQTEKWLIEDVKPKYIHIFQATGADFAINFPGNNSFYTVNVASDDDHGFDFAPIFKSIDKRQEQINDLEKMYKEGQIPVGMIAQLMGIHPLEAWPSFLHGERFGVKCCYGNYHERGAALTLVNNKDCRFVIDPLSLFSLVMLDVHNELSEAYGQLCITQSTLDLYRFYIKERSTQPAHGSMAKVGDQYAFQEQDKDQFKEDTEAFERILKWAEKNCEILPAVGKRDITSDWEEALGLMHGSFFDTIMAASGSDKILLSDDQRLRQLAKGMLDVTGVWIQPAMMGALRRGTLTKNKYVMAVLSLTEANLNFICFETDTLLTLAEMDNWKVSERAKLLLRVLGSKNIELKSALVVAMSFLIDIWKQPIANQTKKNFTFAVLNGLISERPILVQKYVAVVIQSSNRFPRNSQSALLEALEEWSIGHFIPFPPKV